MKTQEPKDEKELYLIDDKKFLSSICGPMIVFFAEQRLPTKKVHLFIPLISYMRNTLKLLVLLLFRSDPSRQLPVVLAIEWIYMMIYLPNNNKIDYWERLIDGYNCISNSLYVILKITSVLNKDSSPRREKVVDILMIILLLMNTIANIGFVVYSMIRNVIPVVKKWKERRSLTDEEKKSIDKETPWKEKVVYKYTDESIVFSSNSTERDNLNGG